MKGAIKQVDGEWIVECTLFLHPTNVKHIKQMSNIFDNVEARIFAHHPIIEFEEKDGCAYIAGFGGEESIKFDSEEDRKIFFDALDKNDEG
jgi:hypothetical protein